MELTAPLGQIGQHQDIAIQRVQGQPLRHGVMQLLHPAVDLARVHHADLADHEGMARYLIGLLVGNEQLTQGGIAQLGAPLQQGLGKGGQDQIGDGQQPLDREPVLCRGGGGGEVEGVADDGPQQQPGLGAGQIVMAHQLQQHCGTAPDRPDPGVEGATGDEGADAVVIDEALHIGLGQPLRPLLQFAEIHQKDRLVGDAARQNRGGRHARRLQDEAGLGNGFTQCIGLGGTTLTVEPVGGDQRGADAVAVGILVAKDMKHEAVPDVG
ncbi:hypothetical protein D3C84_625120 [compost metagenome]